MGRGSSRKRKTASAAIRRSRRPCHLRRTLHFESLEERRLLATFVVNNSDDFPVAMVGDAPGTLRQAIFDANELPGPDTIEFDSALTSGGAATISLSQGELTISDSVSILGPGPDLMAIDATQQSRIFNITTVTGDVALSGLTLTGGKTSGANPSAVVTTYSGGAIRSLTTGGLILSGISISGNRTMGDFARGGGIFCVGSLQLINCTISDNRTLGEPAQGGGVWAGGNVSLMESVVSGNHTAGSRGGGLYSQSGNISLTHSTVSGNSTAGSLYTISGGGGAGVFALNGDVSLSFSNVSDNSTALSYGGGAGIVVWSYGKSVTLSNSTVSGNHTAGAHAYGGGIVSGGTVSLTNSTVSGNSTSGDNAYGAGITSNSAVTLINSTVSGNTTSGSDAGGAGIWGFRGISIQESTISGNVSTGSNSSGGGIYARALVTVYESAITNNQAMHATSTGGGIFQRDFASYYAPVIRGSILAGNSAGGGSADFKPDSQKTPIVNFSIIGVADGLTFAGGVGNLTGTAGVPLDPLLGSLADNGGPTKTHSPLLGSPAIDAGNPDFNPSDPDGNPGTDDASSYDQRGEPFHRVYDGRNTGGRRIDIGAFELQPASTPGDYNLDGINDAADYVMWRKLLGILVVAPFAGADGDGNAVVDPGDYNVWRENFGVALLGTGAESKSREIPGTNTYKVNAEVYSASGAAATSAGKSDEQISVVADIALSQVDAALVSAASVAPHEMRSICQVANVRSSGWRHLAQVPRPDDNIPLLLTTELVQQSLHLEPLVVVANAHDEHCSNDNDEVITSLAESLVIGRGTRNII